MTYLVLSDSHNHPQAVEAAIGRVKPDGVLFAGDGLRDLTRVDIPCPIWAVRGNCDVGSMPLIVSDPGMGDRVLDPEDEELIWADGMRILLMHGHRYGVKHSLTAAVARAIAREADVLVYGHTHEAAEWRITPERPGVFGGSVALSKPLTIFNPGSIGDCHGSFGTITIRDGQVLCGHGRLY